MKADRALVAAEACLALFALAFVSFRAGQEALTQSLSAMSIWPALAFGLTLLLLGFFNVWLPRGDAVDTTVPVAFAAALLLHPAIAAGTVLLARCATIALKPRGHTIASAIEQASRRGLLIAGTYALLSVTARDVLGGRPLRGASDIGWVACAAVLFITADVMLEQLHASARLRAPFVSLVAGALRLQGSMLAAEASTAVLAVLMFPALTYGSLVVTAALLLVMRQSFALLLEVRASYTSTVEVLARSLEAYEPARRGHAERVASMVGAAGRQFGFQGKTLESITYAALFHDVGRLGADDDNEEVALGSAHVLSGVGFLSGAIPILQVLDAKGDVDASLNESDLIGAYMIAAFSAFDSEGRMATSESAELAHAIGARLYAATRKNVDRVIARVEREVEQGSHRPAGLADVVA